MAEHFFPWTPETVSRDEETYTRYCLVIYIIKRNHLHATKKPANEVEFPACRAMRCDATRRRRKCLEADTLRRGPKRVIASVARDASSQPGGASEWPACARSVRT